MVPGKSVVAFVAIALLGVGVLGSSASAGPGACDALISKKKFGPYVGDNVVGTDHATERLQSAVKDGGRMTRPRCTSLSRTTELLRTHACSRAIPVGKP
jgi:hypothetical protein